MPNNLKVGSIFFEMDIDALGNLQNPAPLRLKRVHVRLKQESAKASAISHAYSERHRGLPPAQTREPDGTDTSLGHPKSSKLSPMAGDRLSHRRSLGAIRSYKQLRSKG